MTAEEAVCPGCGAPLAGAYCAACGQRAPADDDFAAGRFFKTVWSEISGSDTRLFRTLRALWIPGELTRAYVAREWRRYMPPLRLYLVLSGVFFLLAWGAYSRGNTQGGADPNLPEALRALFADADAMDDVSDWTAWVKFASVLALAAWVALLQLRSRQPFGVHLAFAAHYYCFDFLLFALAAPLLWWVPDAQLPPVFAAVFAIGMLALVVWCVLALRRVYERSWFAAIAGGVLIVTADFVLSLLSGQIATVIVLLQRM